MLKLYAWEDSFRDRVMDIRDDELKVLRTAAFLSAGSALSWMMAPYLVSSSIYCKFMFIPDPLFSMVDILFDENRA